MLSDLLSFNVVLVAIGTALLGAGCGMVGTFAVLRRRSLTGDALAHAALPGLCIAFLIWQERDLPVLLLGALISGLLGVACISYLRRRTRIKEDAAIGIVLSVFFGAGIALSRVVQNLSTSGNKAGLDSFILNQAAGLLLEDVRVIAIVGAICLSVIALLYKEFATISFDPGFASAQGWPVLFLDLLLMTLIAVVVVSGLPAVGAVMVAALLILPAATARFWTDRLAHLLLYAAFFGAVSGPIGTWLSAWFDRVPTGPTIILTGTALFLVSMFIAPRRGLIARWIEQRRFRHQIELRQTLRAIAEPSIHAIKPGPSNRVSIGLQPGAKFPLPRGFPRAIQRILNRGWLERVGKDRLELTSLGRVHAEAARDDLRLWLAALQRYPDLSRSFGGPDDLLVTEILSREQVEKLRAEINPSPRQAVEGETARKLEISHQAASRNSSP